MSLTTVVLPTPMNRRVSHLLLQTKSHSDYVVLPADAAGPFLLAYTHPLPPPMISAVEVFGKGGVSSESVQKQINEAILALKAEMGK